MRYILKNQLVPPAQDVPKEIIKVSRYSEQKQKKRK
jgi:hypothetical protein